MSKLSFRARALDASKPLPVFRCEDLPDLAEYASINRAVPQMPTGMEKEEESVRETPPPPLGRVPPSPPHPGPPPSPLRKHKMAAIFSPLSPPAGGGGGGRTDGDLGREGAEPRGPVPHLPPALSYGPLSPRPAPRGSWRPFRQAPKGTKGIT